MSIQILDSAVVNQIAAGEVVERPAHLLKELLENSLDAGATEIDVEFDQGGRVVKVKDNGAGMAPTDLPLAVARHATSKIRESSDLWALSSFGFRGEALASIAAVARLRLVSRRGDDSSAHSLHVEYGRLSDVAPTGGEKGTSIWVEDLFTNVPARLKFLKSEASEQGQIKMVLKALALAHPNVTLRVRHKSQLLFFWPAEPSLIKRVEQVLDTSGLHLVEGEELGIKVTVVISPPHVTFRNRKQIWTFVQKRWVQDSTIQAAMMEAYRNLLMHGEYPMAAISIELNPEDLDVNIHPTKSQVKYRSSSDVFRAVQRVIRRGLEEAPWLRNLGGTGRTEALPPSWEPSPTVNTSFRDSGFERVQYAHKSQEPLMTMESLKTYAPQRPFQTMPQRSSAISETANEEVAPTAEAAGTSQETSFWKGLQVLGQAHLTYILTQNTRALLLIDQHAAHERILFERLSRGFREQGLEAQTFLIPLTLDMEADQVEALMAVSSDLRRLGVELDQVGPESVAVREAPVLVTESALAKALRDIASDRLEKGESYALETALGEVLATMACHSAIRAGQALSHSEMVSLMEQMDEFPLSSFCPHGRPVFVEYPFARLERDFGRTV